MFGAGTESDTAVPTGAMMRADIRNYLTQRSFTEKRMTRDCRTQKYPTYKYSTRTFLALLMLCASLLFTLCVRPTPAYAEETSAATAAPASGIETLPATAPAPATDTPSESKTVRVGYFTTRNFQEGGEDEHKRGAGYEYLQKIASLTGWNYEYVYAPFSECLEMLENGEIDLLGNVNYTIDRSRRMSFSSYPEGNDRYWIFTNKEHEEIADGDLSSLEGCRIGVADGSYQQQLITQWLETKRINASVIPCTDYNAMMDGLENDTLDAMVAPGLIVQSDSIPVISIGGGDYYFAVTQSRRDLLSELNAALAEIHTTDPDYNTTLMARYESRASRSYALNREEKKWLSAHQNTMRIGYLEDKLPFCGSENGELVGILATVLDTVKTEYGIRIETVPYKNTKTLGEDLAAGEVDLAGPVIQEFDIMEKYGMVSTESIFDITPVIIYRGNDCARSLQHIVLATSCVYTPQITSVLFPEAEIKKVETIDDCLRAIQRGKAGATIIPSIRLSTMTDNPLLKKLSTTEVAKRQDLVLFTGKENRRAVTIIDKAVEQSAGLLNGVVLAKYSVVKQQATLHDFFDTYAQQAICVSVAIIGVLLLLLSRLVVGQRKLEAALAEAREANAANVAKTTFLNSMSHDIRTPMNAIIGFTNIALSMSPEEKVRNCLEKIMKSSDYLMSLINDVLDISRIESSKIKYAPVPCDITEITDTVLAVAHGFLQGRNIEFVVERATPTAKYVYADELRIREVLINILSNAIKFTKDGGTIRFEVEDQPVGDGKHVEVRYRISDTGIGMSEEYQAHLYEEFSQESDGARTNYKGTGLGMAITKRYVDMMNGEIHVKSKQGVGTTFTVELPLRIADVAPEKKTETGCTERDLQGIRVLMAEDNDLNAEIAITLLEEKGMKVTRAIDGQDVIDQFRATPAGSFDLILMDIMMPKQNGYEATQAIRSMADRPDGKIIPIVAMTANAFAEDIAAAHAAGMNGHLAKPIDMDEVVKVICRVLK